EVDRLNGVAEEYLRFARLPRRVMAREDLNEIIGGLLDFVTPEMQAAGVTVERDLARDLPMIRGDEGQLRAAFLNLLRNSREAMSGGGTIRVRTVRAADGGVEATVADTGPGIPLEQLDKIFDPFFSTKSGGTGLGLAFTLQVVEEHGGTIQCQSEVGRGTLFAVRIPSAPPDGQRLEEVENT
ncbi:MAG: ATP-binding protein, partial [Deltaproteobacteria bacterium]|nr:ATP-binding protein [Deltaproteobacteria bacterium]